MINKTIHTFALLSDEEAGELASSGVFWQSVPRGDSVRQVGDTESMSGVRLLWYIKRTTKQKQTRVLINDKYDSGLPLSRAARVFSPGIYLVTERLECKPLLLCSARILWMNQDCTIRRGGGGGRLTATKAYILGAKRALFFLHVSSCIFPPWIICEHFIFFDRLDRN